MRAISIIKLIMLGKVEYIKCSWNGYGKRKLNVSFILGKHPYHLPARCGFSQRIGVNFQFAEQSNKCQTPDSTITRVHMFISCYLSGVVFHYKSRFNLFSNMLSIKAFYLNLKISTVCGLQKRYSFIWKEY